MKCIWCQHPLPGGEVLPRPSAPCQACLEEARQASDLMGKLHEVFRGEPTTSDNKGE